MTRRPRCRAIRAAMSPIGPEPTTRSVPPSSTSAYSTACHAVGSTSERKRKRSSIGPCGTLIGSVSPNWHPQQLGLPTGHLPVELAVAEQARAGAGVAVLGGLALAVEAARAHPAGAAADVERHHDAVAGRQGRDRGPDLAHDAHRLVADDVARRHERRQRVVEVQVGPAQPGRGHLDDDVRAFLDDRVRDLHDLHVLLALPRDCLHRAMTSSVGRTPLMVRMRGQPVPPDGAVHASPGPDRGPDRGRPARWQVVAAPRRL